MEPGTVLVVSGPAVRNVISVRADGGDTVVQTTPANLNDAIRTGRVGWSRAVSWNAVPRSAYRHAALDSGLQPRTVEAAWAPAPNVPEANVPAADPGTVSFGGTVSGFGVNLDLTPQSDGRLNFSMSAGRSSIKVTAKGWLSSFVSETTLVYQEGTGALFDSEVQGLKGEATWNGPRSGWVPP